jgi:hypothetical protein
MAFQVCAICGRGSNRSSWNNTSGSLVFCDFHDQQEINWAIQNAGTPSPGIVVVDAGTDVSPQA